MYELLKLRKAGTLNVPFLRIGDDDTVHPPDLQSHPLELQYCQAFFALLRQIQRKKGDPADMRYPPLDGMSEPFEDSDDESSIESKGDSMTRSADSIPGEWREKFVSSPGNAEEIIQPVFGECTLKTAAFRQKKKKKLAGGSTEI